MNQPLDKIGIDWICESVGNMTDHIDHISPSVYNEQVRYLPGSVSSKPGYIRYDRTPWLREILDCFDVNSPVRQLNFKKGVQIGWSTLLESCTMYAMGHIKTMPIMYMTADKELADARIENNFIPMLNESGMADIVRSSDEGNSRKTGKTKHHIQFEGGGYLVPFGAQNAKKMRQYSICFMLKDELDGWPDLIGKDGDPDALSDDRCKGYEEQMKIFRGSTPLIKGSSKIQFRYEQGDQRIPIIHCKKCNFPQMIRWNDPKDIGGMKWDMDERMIIKESVRWCCIECGEPHFEYDKTNLFDPSHGAHWKPTAKPTSPDIRSYHLPSMYASIGMGSWYSCVESYVSGWDMASNKVSDIGKYQKFYNNILGEPFEVIGAKIKFTQVSAHRRSAYKFGQIPNTYAAQYSGSKILFMTCTVDVHKRNLAVIVMGWTKDAKSYVIDYWRFEDEREEPECGSLDSPVWNRLQELIDEAIYTADDGSKYRLAVTLIDSGYANDTVCQFCSQWEAGVYPILGRERTAKNQKISEFAEFKTQAGTVGYRILVDHYKDRIAPVLRREWVEDEGDQRFYHFNAPIDIKDKQLKELTVETRREKKDDRGNTSYYWHRPGNAPNELWDLLVYGHAAVEIIAYNLCIQTFGLDTVDWSRFWQYIEEEKLFFTD